MAYRTASGRRRNGSPSSSRGGRPSSASWFRSVLVSTVCICVPVLLITSWDATHQLNRNVTQDSVLYQQENRTTNLTLKKSVYDQSWSEPVSIETNNQISKYHFCGKSLVAAGAETGADTNNNTLYLLYQCSGTSYETFAASLRSLAYNRTQSPWDWQGDRSRQSEHAGKEECAAQSSLLLPTHPLWGKREFPLPDNATILVLGNSHLRQISKTLACQYADSLTSIRFLPAILSENRTSTSDAVDDSSPLTSFMPSSSDGFVLEFANKARWVSITNTVLVYSHNWKELLEEFFLSSLPGDSLSSETVRLDNVDAIVLGKFTTFNEARGTNFERTMAQEEEAYHEFRRKQQQEAQPYETYDNVDYETEDSGSAPEKPIQVDFASIPPPDLIDLARVYDGPILSVNMFSKSDSERAQSSYKAYQEQCSVLEHNKKANETSNFLRGGGDKGSVSSTDQAKINKKIFLISGRRYIDELQMECGTDDKLTLGTCHEPTPWIATVDDNSAVESVVASHSQNEQERATSALPHKRYRDPSDMHRCAGRLGGHADLISWDVIEGLHYFQADVVFDSNGS